jgi:LAS superfamily LD-carboxypeptidase LdcB
MIHTNQKYINTAIVIDSLENSSLKVWLVLLLIAGLFFGVASLNVAALDYSSLVEAQTSICLEDYEIGISLGLDSISETQLDQAFGQSYALCFPPQPYIYGYSMDLIYRDQIHIKELITQKQDQQRIRRRELIDQQKQVAGQLQAFGIESQLLIPERDQPLREQVLSLETKINELTEQYNYIKSDIKSQVQIYKYFVFVENNPDVLGMQNVIALGEATEVSVRYVDLKKQNAAWAGQSTLFASASNTFLYPIFSPQEFITVADNTSWHAPLSAKIYSQITGISDLDRLIVDIAWDRGYRPRQSIDQTTLIGVRTYTQPQSAQLAAEVAQSWIELEQAATAEGIGLQLNSGYRSEMQQRELFTSRLRDNSFVVIGRELTSGDVTTQVGQNIVRTTLEMTAPPGYSKHHTGHTIDLGYRYNNGQRAGSFEDSPGYAWLSANNYYNAKRFGFVPSYPLGVELIGPEPESWEYVWVGPLEVKMP